MPADFTICPTCEQLFPTAAMEMHREAEDSDLRRLTLSLIGQRYSEWIGPGGDLDKCRDYYSQLDRMIEVAVAPPLLPAS